VIISGLTLTITVGAVLLFAIALAVVRARRRG
jgi:hypothetical protein